MRRLSTLFLAALLPVIVGLGMSGPAGAANGDCSAGDLQFRFASSSGLDSVHRNGDELELTLLAENDQADSSCDWTDVSISLNLPATADGDAGTTTVPVTDGDSIPAGMEQEAFGETVPYVVDLPADESFAPIEVSFRGIPALPGDVPVTLTETVAYLVITRPVIDLAVSSDLNVGPPPLTVNYVYMAANVSPPPGGPPPSPPGGPDPGPAPALVPPFPGPEARDILTDDICDSPQYDTGDRPNDSGGNDTGAAWLDPGHSADSVEEWQFTCTHTFERPGVFTNRVRIEGSSSRDERPWPATTASATVTVLGPDLTVEKDHRGNLLAGQESSYSLTVSNHGTAATAATVLLRDLLPDGLRPKAINGDGWDCELATLACERSDPLAAGSKWPVVTVDVVPAGNAPNRVVNVATVSGGGEVEAATDNNSARDPTAIRTPARPSPADRAGFRVLRLKSRGNGTALLLVRIKRRGVFRVDDVRRRRLVRVRRNGRVKTVLRRSPDLIRKVERRIRRPGTGRLLIRPTRILNRALRRRQRAGNRHPVRVRLGVSLRRADGKRFATTIRIGFRRG